MRTKTIRVDLMVVLALFIAVTAVSATFARPEEATAIKASQTVRVTLRRGEAREGQRAVVNTVETVLVDGHGPSMVETGWRVPIATGGGETGGEISYQHVGFSMRLRARVLGGGRVELQGNVEESTLDDRPSTVPSPASPTLRTFRQDVDAVLVDGEPMRVGSFVDAAGTSSFVEIEVDVLE